MSVHYKFKNTIEYDAVKFDGVYISASNLRSIIIQQKKLGNSDLRLENEETHQLYADDQLIPKNTNIIVSRLPMASSNKRTRLAASSSASSSHHNNRPQPVATPSSSNDGVSGGREAMELVSNKNQTEEERKKYIQSQSTKDFDPALYARSGRGGGLGGRGGHRSHFVPRAGYTCKKCGIPGHSIYDCKVSSMHKPVKRSSGIPRVFLTPVDPKEKGALLTPSGEYVVPILDREAYNNPKVEKAPFFEDGTPSDDIKTTSSSNNTASKPIVTHTK